MTLTTDSTATATLSGRELALNRRKAMALHGKTGVTKTASVMSAKPAASRVAPAAAAAPGLSQASATSASDAAIMAQARAAVASSGRNASRARREALSTSGKAALQPTASRPSGRVRQKPQSGGAAYASAATVAEVPAKGCGCGCNGAKGGCGDTQASAGMMPAAAVSPASDVPKKAVEPTGRALARARRAALSQDGKAGLKRVAQATKIASTMPGQDWQVAITKGATGRQKAMQRRVVQSLAGNMKASNEARPAGRMRARLDTPAPVKVEEGHTLSGHGVTGTMVERSKKVTGNEPGSCRAVTGTEYIGAEQFDTLCSTRPAPAPGCPGRFGPESVLERPAVAGMRILAVAGNMTMAAMATELKRAYPKRRIATRVAPMVVLRLLALFDPQIKAILPAVGKEHPMSNARAREVLDMRFISPEGALRASAEWLLEKGEV
jgi:hypothetical protein